jgi:sugar (pentulose or hexulose) kinase
MDACATGERSSSDWNNALKLGFDVHMLQYFSALKEQDFSHLLPENVLQPGAPVKAISQEVAGLTGLPLECQVVAGTTDSVAAFLASGADSIGDAVTSLGSTMAIKLLSEMPVDDGRYGIYSHRVGAVLNVVTTYGCAAPWADMVHVLCHCLSAAACCSMLCNFLLCHSIGYAILMCRR